MDKAFLQRLQHRVNESIESAADQLVNGRVKSQEEYREIVGLIRGLRLTMEYVIDLLRSYRESDDE